MGTGAAQTRTLVISALTTTQLVTVEKTQDAINYHTAPYTYARL